VSCPVVLVEGPEKCGKTTAAVILSASDRVGRTFWLDRGEGSADEYGAWPGARFEIVEGESDWSTLVRRVDEVKAYAQWAKDSGEKPAVLVVDTMSDVWAGLSAWASDRQRERLAKRGRRVGEDVEVKPTVDLWNDANRRHGTLMTKFLTFPGIVILLARGKEIASFDDAGKPVERQKDYRVDGQKNLGFDATVWMRLSRTEPPTIIGARSVHAGIRPGIDESQPVLVKEADGRLLEWLIFDAIRFDPQNTQVRDIVSTTVGALLPEEGGEDPRAAKLRDDALSNTATFEQVGAMYRQAVADGLDRLMVGNGLDDTTMPLGELLKLRGKELAPRPALAQVAANGSAPAERAA